MKKWICFLLIGVFASGIIAGCSGGGDTSEDVAPKVDPDKKPPAGQEARTSKPAEAL